MHTPGSLHVPSSRFFSNSPYVVPPQRPQRQPSSSSGYLYAVKPRNSFVATDPFRVSHWDQQLDASSDELTFDNIQISTGSAPGLKAVVAFPLEENFPDNAPSYGPHRQNHGSTQSNISSVPASHIYGDTPGPAMPSVYHSAAVGQKYGDTVTHISFPTFQLIHRRPPAVPKKHHIRVRTISRTPMKVLLDLTLFTHLNRSTLADFINLQRTRLFFSIREGCPQIRVDNFLYADVSTYLAPTPFALFFSRGSNLRGSRYDFAWNQEDSARDGFPRVEIRIRNRSGLRII